MARIGAVLILSGAAVLAAPASAAAGTGSDPEVSAESWIHLLSKGTPPERRLAARKLRDLDTAATPAVLPLAFALKSEDRLVRRLATAALANIGPPAADAVPRLVELLRHPDSYLRQYSAIALGRIGAKSAETIEPLSALLTDENRYVRRSAGGALAALGISTSQTLSRCVAALDDRDAAVRANAAWAILNFNSDGAPPELGRALLKIMRVQEVVRVGLPRPWREEDVEGEVKLVDLRNAAVKKLAATRTAAESVVPDLAALVEADPNGNGDLIPVIGSTGPNGDTAVPVLIGLLKPATTATEPSVDADRIDDTVDPAQVLAALRAIGPNARRAIPVIERFLFDGDERIVVAAIQALESVDTPVRQDSVPALLRFMGAHDADAASDTGGDGTAADRVGEPQSRVRATAAAAMDRLQPDWRVHFNAARSTEDPGAVPPGR